MVKCSPRRALARSADGRGLVRRPTNREAGISFMPIFGDARDEMEWMREMRSQLGLPMGEL